MEGGTTATAGGWSMVWRATAGGGTVARSGRDCWCFLFSSCVDSNAIAFWGGAPLSRGNSMGLILDTSSLQTTVTGITCPKTPRDPMSPEKGEARNEQSSPVAVTPWGQPRRPALPNQSQSCSRGQASRSQTLVSEDKFSDIRVRGALFITCQRRRRFQCRHECRSLVPPSRSGGSILFVSSRSVFKG